MKGKRIIAFAEIGSHGGIFEFVCGPVADRYPHLLHIYRERVTPDLVPVEIRPCDPPRRRRAERKSK